MNKVLTTAAAICLIAVSFGLTSCKKENNMNNIKQDDPEFAALWDNFMQRDVLAHGNLDAKKRYLIVMAAHIATQSVNGYKVVLNEALDNGVSPVEAKEVVYQAVPYVGMAKVYDFFTAANDVMRQRGITLPLAGQSTTTPDNRFDKGLAQQVGIFGDRILQAHATAPQNQKHIQNFLSANCFGDYYTRTGLNIPTRELLTFAYLISMGGAENQVKGHIQGNLNVGNDKEVLLDAITQLLPYIGYPRSLNAIAAVNEIAKE